MSAFLIYTICILVTALVLAAIFTILFAADNFLVKDLDGSSVVWIVLIGSLSWPIPVIILPLIWVYGKLFRWAKAHKEKVNDLVDKAYNTD